MLLRPLPHGTYIDDLFLGIVFVVMLAVFLYFYFSDKGESDEKDLSDRDNTDVH